MSPNATTLSQPNRATTKTKTRKSLRHTWNVCVCWVERTLLRTCGNKSVWGHIHLPASVVCLKHKQWFVAPPSSCQSKWILTPAKCQRASTSHHICCEMWTFFSFIFKNIKTFNCPGNVCIDVNPVINVAWN